MCIRDSIHIEVTPVAFTELASERETEKSAAVRERVVKARQVQEQRYKGTKMHSNAQISTQQLRKYCRIDATGQALLQKAMERLGLSARAYDRILKVARTIADLAGSNDTVSYTHLRAHETVLDLVCRLLLDNKTT